MNGFSNLLSPSFAANFTSLECLDNCIKVLNLGHNDFSGLLDFCYCTLVPVLPELTNLWVLNLRGNHLMGTSDLSQNQLASLPKSMEKLTRLTELNLSVNRFVVFPEAASLPSLSPFHLHLRRKYLSGRMSL
jgi:hypothetical protein